MSNQEESADLTPVLLSQAEELLNAVTHGIGLVLSIAGAVVLVACARSQGDAWRVAGCSVYATTLVAVYASSTLSHIALKPKLKRLFRTLDQGFIYLLIAGSFTPFALAYLRTGWWWLLFGLIWAVALFGFFGKILFAHRVEAVSVASYVLLGWMPIIAVMALIELVPAVALWWMLIGGVCYTAGTAFLIHDTKVLHFHAIWHMFVVAGSACHFFSILFFVAQVS